MCSSTYLSYGAFVLPNNWNPPVRTQTGKVHVIQSHRIVCCFSFGGFGRVHGVVYFEQSVRGFPACMLAVAASCVRQF